MTVTVDKPLERAK